MSVGIRTEIYNFTSRTKRSTDYFYTNSNKLYNSSHAEKSYFLPRLLHQNQTKKLEKLSHFFLV